MVRHQSLLSILLTVALATTVAADQAATSNAESNNPSPSAATVTGKLKHNSADRDGTMPYVLVDRWGVVQGFVSPTPGVNLESYLDRSLTVRGSTCPSNDGQTRVLAEKVETPNTGTAPRQPAPRQAAAPKAPAHRVRQVAHEESVDEAPLPMPKTATATARPQSKPARTAVPARTARRQSQVRATSAAEEYAEPDSASCGDDGCDADCADDCCDECGCGEPYCFPLTQKIWFRADYLMFWTKGMATPPLVTQGASPRQPGFFDPTGANGTKVLFGHERILDDQRSGGRFQAGLWLDECHTVGLQGDFMALEDDNVHFRQWSSGNPIISRPFFDALQNIENIEKVAYPRGVPSTVPNNASIDGSVSVDAFSRFESAGASLKICLGSGQWNDACVNAGCRTDFLVGYRFLRLDDQIGVREELTSTVTPFDAFLVQDNFSSKNYFNGCDLGLARVWYRGRWSFEATPKIAFGNTHQIVHIAGSTERTNSNGSTIIFPEGGLLAQATNIGQYTKNTFSVVPEIGLNLGYQITPKLRATFGYTFMYWSEVARAAEQIDYSVNANLLPPQNPRTAAGPRVPAFAFQETGYWAQGLNFGLGYRW